MVVGPYTSYPAGDGKVDLYLLRFDKNGALQSPRTAQLLKDEITDNSSTDVFVFSHGWNNDFDTAFTRYDSFITGYLEQRARFGLTPPTPYRPVLVGLVWPSTSFLVPWENAPVIAAAPSDDARATEEMIRLLTADLDPDDASRFAELVDGGQPLGLDDAREAAEITRRALPRGGDPDGRVRRPTSGDILASWQALADGPDETPPGPDDFGTTETAGPTMGAPAAAGLGFDPRAVLRMGTVWKMHARAGTVGANGVSALLQWLLDRDPGPRVHLVGHSFGAKVVLSALSIGEAPARPARSMLLLQPAVNRWCFAPSVDSDGAAGGYHVALDRVERPIWATFSLHDHPLHDMFQLVMRDVGEMQIAGYGDADRYGALGGYGPNGLGELACVAPAVEAGAGHYDAPQGVRVLALDGGVELSGGAAIKSHSDVSNPVTWWALHQLTRIE